MNSGNTLLTNLSIEEFNVMLVQYYENKALG